MRNPFRRPPAQKASRTARLVSVETLGRPVWTPRDYAALAREGYMRNAVAHRCVALLAQAAAALPLLLYAGDRELARHPLLDLLARPNPRQAGTALFEAAYGHLLVSGNCYIEAVAVEREVRELFALRPDRVKVVPGRDGWPLAYDYTVGGATVRLDQGALPVPQVLQLQLFHPLDDHYGLSPLEAAATALDTHNAAASWQKALIDNSARPSGALVYDGPDGAALTAEQFSRLKSELEESFQGAANAGRPLLLEGGLDWKPMALGPRDLDFAELRNAAAREIALAFGVPPMLLGIPGDNTFANYREANRALLRQTALPLAGRMLDGLAHWLSPAFGGEALRLAPDLDRVEALSEEREALWRRVAEADFLTRAEKREAVGYGAGEGPGDGQGDGPGDGPGDGQGDGQGDGPTEGEE
jgi:HK97 family phage portal protein